MKRAVIFGRGGHARVIASLLARDATFLAEEEIDRFFERADDYRDAEVYLGIGNNADRRRLFEKLLAIGIRPATCIAPTAFVAKTAEIGKGTVICPGAVVMTGARIGANGIVNTLSSVDHDCRIADHVQLSVGVSLPGEVTVGESCFFGVKSATFPRLSIGDHVIVRGGSLVVKDLPGFVVAGGNPARVLRSLDTQALPTR